MQLGIPFLTPDTVQKKNPAYQYRIINIYNRHILSLHFKLRLGFNAHGVNFG